jgi:uncharacterized membrane protein
MVSFFVIPLVLTLLIELPVIGIAGRRTLRRALKAGLLVNVLTNPVLVLALLALSSALPVLRAYFGISSLQLPLFYLGVLAGLEVAVVVVEWRLLKWVLGWTNRRSLVTSVIANGLSLVLGPVVLWIVSSLFPG